MDKPAPEKLNQSVF